MPARRNSAGAAAPQSWRGRVALIAAYREGSAFAAILVIGGGVAVRTVAAGCDGEAALAPNESIAARWWCRRAAQAASVAEAIATARTVRSVAQACDGVVRAARRHGIALLSDADIRDEAMRAILRLDGEIERQMQAGALKSVNRAYRHYRLEASARGGAVLRYADWMERYKAGLVRDIAATLRLV